MPCDSERYYEQEYRKPEKLAARGLSPEEIAELQAKVNLAAEKAKAKAFSEGTTLSEQKRRITEAELKAVKEWHREQHARLERDMDLLRHLAKVKMPDRVSS